MVAGKWQLNEEEEEELQHTEAGDGISRSQLAERGIILGLGRLNETTALDYCFLFPFPYEIVPNST